MQRSLKTSGLEFSEELSRLRDKWIIVEGKKDRIALNKLGLTNIIELNKAIYRIVEEITDQEIKEVAILTDLDREGKKLYSLLKKDLSEHGVRIDDRFRIFLFKQTTLTQIEGMVRYFNSKDRWCLQSPGT